MEKFVRGQIVIIPFPFSDLSNAKRRPALVLAILPMDDLLLCQITSKSKLDHHAIALDKSDFETNQLPVQSYVRCGKMFAASTSIVERVACQIHEQALAEISRRNADIVLGTDWQAPGDSPQPE